MIIKFARIGKMEGEGALRQLCNEAVKMQLDLDFNEKPFFRSALWEATWKNQEAICKLLIDKGASVSFADFQGRTPLHEAAYYGHLNLVEYFIEKGHPVDVVDNFGQTPLFRAVEGARHEVVKALVKHNAQTNILDSHEVTVQHCAAFSGSPQMSDWLLYQGSWRNRFIVDDSTKRKAVGDLQKAMQTQNAAALHAAIEAATAAGVPAQEIDAASKRLHIVEDAQAKEAASPA